MNDACGNLVSANQFVFLSLKRRNSTDLFVSLYTVNLPRRINFDVKSEGINFAIFALLIIIY